MQDKSPKKIGSENKIKIGYIITKGVWGGAQKYVYTLALEAKKNYDVFVICGEGNILKTKLEENGIKVYEILNMKRDISLLSEIKSSFTMLQIIRRESPDVIHLNSPKASGFGSVAGRLTGVRKIIMTAHGFAFNEERPLWQVALSYFFSYITILLCHKTIVINEKERNQALRMPFVDDSKVKLIRNGVKPAKYIDKTIVQEAILTRVPNARNTAMNKPLWIGTIAELHRNKGLEYALQALSKIKTPFLYFIIGGGEEKSNLEKQITDLGLSEKVFLVGFLENANVYLKAFDIFLLTSIKEGLPYTLLEAGQAGLPVVATNVGGVPDIIQNRINGLLITKAKSGEIVQALQYMMEKPEERKKFAKNLKERVEKEFSLNKMIEKIFKLYK